TPALQSHTLLQPVFFALFSSELSNNRMAITLARAIFGLVVFQLSMLSAFAIYNDSIWVRDVSYDDLSSLDADNASFAVQTELQCARSCQGNTSCNSFFYNSVSKQCRLQRYVFVSALYSTVVDTGSRYYRLMSGLCSLEEGYVVDRLTTGDSLAVLDPIERLDFLYNFFNRNE
ncbi:hypothetical protein BaRGS_00017432, partial [Batillaria attramentaria]